MAMIRRTLYEVALVALITLVLSAAAYVIHPHALPLWTVDSTGISGKTARTEFSPINLAEAIAHYNQKTALFIDARPEGIFTQGHIRGAIHLDPNEFELWSETLIDKYPPEQPIITYCEGEACSLSTDLAEKLIWLGFENVFYLADGWGHWKRQQLPTSLE
jgi:rhodanese-related sulfurtransferase